MKIIIVLKNTGSKYEFHVSTECQQINNKHILSRENKRIFLFPTNCDLSIKQFLFFCFTNLMYQTRLLMINNYFWRKHKTKIKLFFSTKKIIYVPLLEKMVDPIKYYGIISNRGILIFVD
jgi:hypothetical protein